MTHNERVLQLLSDGKPHSHHELYGLHVIAHSRVADLRKQGYQIDQWREGDLYLYRLSQTSAGDPRRLPTSLSPRPVDGRGTAAVATPSPAEQQLQLIDAA